MLIAAITAFFLDIECLSLPYMFTSSQQQKFIQQKTGINEEAGKTDLILIQQFFIDDVHY